MATDSSDVPAQSARAVQTALEVSVDASAVDWEPGDVLSLPEGVEVARLHENDAEGRLDTLIRFPPGYVEPRHTHLGAHAALLLEGRMLVEGHELTPGDYYYGHRQPHGPMEYPDGCTLFASFVGGSPAHDYDEDAA